MGKIEPRSITPILGAFRNMLLGRSHRTPLRYADRYSPRTQPPPQIPDGPSHLLSANYYYTRDGRREVAPPVTIVDCVRPKLIESPKESPKALAPGSRVPGVQWKWD